MRVALISPLFESVPPRFYGGTERVVYNLIRGLTEADIEVTLFASGDSFVEGRVISVVDQAFRLCEEPVPDPNAHHVRMLSLVARQAHDFDIIHNHHDYWMLPLSEMIDVPLVTTLHGRLDLPGLPEVFGAYPKTHYVSISDAQRTPVPHLPWIRTIHHGLDISGFRFNPKPGNYLAFLGRMSPEKGPEAAIEIARRAGIPLKMAAKIDPGPVADYYEAHVKPKIDGKFIEYIGEITEAEKSEFLGNALALVFPINWPEPFGLVLIESLACGTPVLARPCGAAPEILKDGITGYSHPDLQVLADRLGSIHKISRSGCRQWVEKNFSLRGMVEKYLQVYQTLVPKRLHPSRAFLSPGTEL